MRQGRRTWAAAMLAAWIGIGSGCTADAAGVAATEAPPDLPPIPERPLEQQFAGAPPQWRDYFRQVRAARRVEDPLARCLAWPDLPGNRWPAGHAEAHCRYHHAPVPTPAEVEAHLDRGEVEALDAMLEARFGEDGAADGRHEEVHAFFGGFAGLVDDGTEAAERITTRWLALAPGSAWAAVARAQVLESLGWTARGERWARETGAARFEAFHGYLAQAEPLYRRALEIDPDMASAYVGLLRIGHTGSRADIAGWAWEEGRRRAPGCAELVVFQLQGLQPRWGGSLEAMAALVEEIRPQVAQVPLLANQLVALQADAAHSMISADRYTAELAAMLADAVAIASNDDALRRAAQADLHRTDGSRPDYDRALAMLLQAERWSVLDPWQSRRVAERLLRLEPEWALAMAAAAIAAEPDDANGQYLFAAASYNVRRFEQAEAHYRRAIESPDYRQASLRELSTMWLWSAGLPPAEALRRGSPWLDRLLAEYPSDGRARMYALARKTMRGEPVTVADFRHYLEVADRGDPDQKQVFEDAMRATGDPVPAGADRSSGSR